jgi:hypothetical protein
LKASQDYFLLLSRLDLHFLFAVPFLLLVVYFRKQGLNMLLSLLNSFDQIRNDLLKYFEELTLAYLEYFAGARRHSRVGLFQPERLNLPKELSTAQCEDGLALLGDFASLVSFHNEFA